MAWEIQGKLGSWEPFSLPSDIAIGLSVAGVNGSVSVDMCWEQVLGCCL